MATESVASGHRQPAASAIDFDDIREYQKVVHFRDAVVSGKHPRIKVPPSVGKSTTPLQPSTFIPHATERVAPSTQSSRTGKAVNGYQLDNMQSFKANSQQPAVAVAVAPTASASASTIPGVFRASASGKTEFNPILLEKSDGLIKAEVQLQRQRLEKALKDQVDQRRASMKTSLQPSEQLPEFDLSDILAKALTLVQATAAPSTANAPVAANASDASDSFDENTFYSSQHDTPEPQASPRAQDAPEDVPMKEAPATTNQHNAYPPPHQFAGQSFTAPTPASHQSNIARNAAPLHHAATPGQYAPTAGGPYQPMQDHGATRIPNIGAQTGLMGQPQQRAAGETQVISSDSGAASRSDNSGNTDSDHPGDHGRIHNAHQLLPNAFRQHESPLVRAHNLSPFAPQPAHVSPLALARHPPLPEPEVNILQGAPAQVRALRRQEHAVVTSPESSPQGEKGSKKKNKKKNKRKAEGRAAEAPGSPDIKPEPRSPSPLTAPQFARPQKRQRPSGRQDQEIIYDEPRLERPVSRLHHEQYPPGPIRVERLPLDYERVGDPYARAARHSVAPSYIPEPSVHEERRHDGTVVQYIRRVQSPAGYPIPYGAGEPPSVRASSYSIMNPYREVPPYERDGRMSVRPHADRARSRSPMMVERRSPIMAPPAAPTSRIVIDEYGREYIEPPRASTISRRSVMPSARPGEHEVVYERAPIRAPSRMAGAETFEQDGVIYRRASPAYAPRRVVTQPEYGADYRGYRERDYPVPPAQQMGPPGQDFVQIRGGSERRMPEEISREYIPRATSIRPPEAVPYYNRLSSTRPDVPPRQYAASVHPEARREAAPHIVREYASGVHPEARREAAPPTGREFSVRPAESEMPRREFSVRPVERYYERPPPRDEEVTYIERPRPVPQEIIYADGGRRQVYQ